MMEQLENEKQEKSVLRQDLLMTQDKLAEQRSRFKEQKLALDQAESKIQSLHTEMVESNTLSSERWTSLQTKYEQSLT